MDANDFPRLFYTSMPSSSTSTHRSDRFSACFSPLILREDFRRHSTSSSFPTSSSNESVETKKNSEEEQVEIVSVKSELSEKIEETRVSDYDYSLNTFYTAHEVTSMISRNTHDKTLTPDDQNRTFNTNQQNSSDDVADSRSLNSSFGFDGHVAFVDEPTENSPQPQQPPHHFQLPTLLVTSTPSTVFDQNDDDIFFPPQSPYHPPSRQYSSSSEPMMSGLTFQLQSGIHKKSVAVEANEIALRDLRHEAFQFVKEIYPEKKCGSLEDYILLYKHDLRSINILQLITTSSDVTDGTLVEVVIGCSLDRHSGIRLARSV
ncbi:hypothetical protein CRE_08646 [Caenorhabditis remanei]|uniref:Serine/threonine-protein kinase D1-3-like ubiquitin-like domain-containing protein n=1 Tax=Caenorhabditis remanei TaxID=31234 RepID=E3LJ12_CAERE|nr:hypothetical protein CRE_08646 [Caenorhabditis remanei]